jgi:hypothetical protein
MSEAKPCSISKPEVWEAYQKVQANHGAAGIDGQSIAEFETRVKDTLYRLWNRMSSGSYFPAARADGDHTESKRRGKEARNTDRVGSDRADGGEVETGARGGPTVSSRFLWVASWEVGAGGRGANPAALLEAGLGH